MTLSRRPSPFGELLSLRQAMDRLFEDSFVRSPAAFGQTDDLGLPLDISMSSDELVVRAAMPGVEPDDVEITVEDGTLTIAGEHAEERNDKDGDVLLREIRHGRFRRSVVLPNGLEPDRARASFENGVLTLRIPKAEAAKPRQIRISPTITSNAERTGDRPVAASPTQDPQA